MNITNQTSKINANFYFRINATDEEDGGSAISGNSNFTFNYTFLNDGKANDILNASIFNFTTGEINITFNSSQHGKYHLLVNATDFGGKNDTKNFWLFVYNTPNITFSSSNAFAFAENFSFNLTFRANHSIQDNLTFHFFINNVLKYNISYFGNDTNLTWNYNINFTQETYGQKNLTLTLLNPIYNDLNFSYNWNITINHTNFPIEFYQNISNSVISSSQLLIILSDYFRDYDASDKNLNQTIGFIVNNVSGGGISVSITNWTNTTTPLVTFTLQSTSGDYSVDYNITAYEYNISNMSQLLRNVTSNNFSVRLIVASPTTTTTSSGGGGGGGGGTLIRYVSIKIIGPGDFVSLDRDRIRIPIEIKNNGLTTLTGINLAGTILFNNLETQDVRINLENSYIDSLAPGTSRNITVDIFADTQKIGRYKATIFANVNSPKLSDFGDFFIELASSNESSNARKEIVFTEKLVSENPECLELNELLKEAQRLYEGGDYENSRKKTEEAIKACEQSISKNEQVSYVKNYIKDKFYYAFFLTVIIFAFGFVFYFYRRIKFNKLKSDEYI